jgi:uncharacterized protein (TIGR02284 family)
MINDEVYSHLKDLIAVARDSELGYRTAAEHVADSHLKTIFGEYAKQRGKFVQELREQGELPDEGGTVGGAVFRGWMNLKSAVTGGGAAAIVAACETGEDSAAAAYERVVNTPISGNVRSVVEAQWAKVKEAHQRMVHLKRELEE